MAHISLAVYDYQRKKLCNLYDSFSQATGQAYNIYYTEELDGWKEVSFTLPFMAEKKHNYRWDYIKNEYLLRQKIDDTIDWFILQTPKKTKNGRAVSDTVKCSHISVQLKTKNLYLTLDDTNGIGTIQYLAGVILKNTGWTLGNCDTFYERDGTTEKIRSLTSDGKKGSYQQITDLCDLFNGYPVYNGNTKTVDIHQLKNKKQMTELTMGRNLNSQTVETDTSNIVTRLYVEGEYGDYGYVGIDDVNPTGLNFLLDFDYYKSLGLFTSVHQAALNTYLTQMPAKNRQIMSQMATILLSEDQLNQLWGQISYVIYVLNRGSITRIIKGGTVISGQETIQPTDELVVLPISGNYRTVTGANFTSSDKYAVKFITLPSGNIGARQVAVESKQKMVVTLQADYQEATTDLKRQLIQQQIATYNYNINQIYNGTDDVTGLYEAMRVAIEQAVEIDAENTVLTTLQSEQEAIESAFATAMGEMLSDGYWSNTNYAPGQEEWLYWDAIERMDEVSRPTVKYGISQISLIEQGYKEKLPEINAKVRIWDEDLGVNDIVYVTKRTLCLDNYNKDTIEISNEGLRSAAVTFESIFGKVTQLSDLVNQRSVLYERAKAINANGTLPVDKVIGDFNVSLSNITSPTSNWYTDGKGSLIFESILGDSAFKIGGDGFMIANSKDGSGDWRWRIIGSGSGFSTDAITQGYLNPDRLEDYTVEVVKLSNDVGANLNISMNPTTQGILAETGIENQDEGETLYGRIEFNAGNIENLVAKTGVNSLGVSETLYSRISQNAESISQEVTRAQNAEGNKIDKTNQFQTVDAIIQDAQTKADAAATSAKNASIAKTSTQQTADAIVNSAVALAKTDAGNTYIAKTSSYQTADAMVNEAVRVAGVNADSAYLAKSGTYTTVNAILQEAQNKADTAAVTAKNASIAKTQTYQDAASIVNAAVAQASTDAGNTYIAKTTTYQTADAIIAAAEAYTDDNAYRQISGIAITAEGVEISGSKYVKINSGGSFQLSSDNLLINSTSGVIKANSNGTQAFYCGAGRTQIRALDIYSTYDNSYTDVTDAISKLDYYGWIRNASVSGNTLTLTKDNGGTVQFTPAGGSGFSPSYGLQQLNSILQDATWSTTSGKLTLYLSGNYSISLAAGYHDAD